MDTSLTFKLGGPAGSGIMTVGNTLAKILKRSGLYTYSCKDYPSLIKGGHNLYMIHASKVMVHSNIKRTDVVVALDQMTLDKNTEAIKNCKVLIYDNESIKDLKADTGNAKVLPVPFTKIATDIGSRLFANTVSLGAVCGVVKTDLEIAKELLTKAFKRKGDDIVQKNIDALQQGYDSTAEASKGLGLNVEKQEDNKRIIVDGNKALAYGAIKSGCKFMSSYPMTPATSIMQTLAANEMEYNIILKQTEDEIAAINMAIGAAFTGARAMAATSGGGFSLMSEAIGMSGIAEVPLVLVEVQRAGTSTGIPTYTGQGDLRMVQHASQGEFPRILIAPGDPAECFYDGFEAFNLAEIYQTPIILISDKELATMEVTMDKFKTEHLQINRGKLQTDEEMQKNQDYKRYKLSDDGISPRCIPGQPNGMHVAGSYEHDETGWTTEEADMQVMQSDNRTKKLQFLYDFNNGINTYGDSDCDIQLVFWGSTKGACLEALKEFKKIGIKVKLIQVHFIHPFPIKQFEDAFDTNKQSLILEHNKTGQLRGIIRENTGIFIENFYGKYDARPIYPDDIVERVRKILQK